MPDESAADDGAIYALWDRLTLDEVTTAHDRLERLWRAYVRLRGNPPPAELIAEARHLRETQLKLVQLPWLATLAAL